MHHNLKDVRNVLLITVFWVLPDSVLQIGNVRVQ